ncbi:MAG: FecCD family ABC transporter permease [Chloroflexota bacterium]
MFIISLQIGRYPVSVGDLVSVLLAKIFPIEHSVPAAVDNVLFQIRLPRIIAAGLVGGALAVAGAAYQGMFRNPLVSPDILGASAGAAFGGALGIYLSLGASGVQILAFLFGLLAVFASYGIASRIRQDPILVLVLAGILIGTLFSSATTILKLLSDAQDKLPSIVYWMMGSLSQVSPRELPLAAIAMALALIPLYLVRWRLNVMAMGEDEAKSLGLDTNRLRLLVILCATAMTAAAVSISGLIGWVGLVIPHLCRLLVGPDHTKLLPASLLIGSAYLLLIDDLARGFTAIELPLGVLTSLIGAPFFIYILLNSRKGWV